MHRYFDPKPNEIRDPPTFVNWHGSHTDRYKPSSQVLDNQITVHLLETWSITGHRLAISTLDCRWPRGFRLNHLAWAVRPHAERILRRFEALRLAELRRGTNTLTSKKCDGAKQSKRHCLFLKASHRHNRWQLRLSALSHPSQGPGL